MVSIYPDICRHDYVHVESEREREGEGEGERERVCGSKHSIQNCIVFIHICCFVSSASPSTKFGSGPCLPKGLQELRIRVDGG